MTNKEQQNRRRCLKCKHYRSNVCPLMANGDVFNLDTCILDTLSKKDWAEDSPEMFMFKHNSTLMLSYLSFHRKDKLPKIGDKVITLHSGFGGFGGSIQYVVGLTDTCIQLAKDSSATDASSISDISEWYRDLFVLDDNN